MMYKILPIALMAAVVLAGYSQSSVAAPSPVQSSSKDDSGSSSKKSDGSSMKSETTEKAKSDTTAAPAKMDDAKSGSDSKMAGDSKATDSKATDSKATDSKATDSKAADSKAADSKAADSKAADSSAKDGTSAADSDTITVEEDFWYPFRYSFADAIHNAHLDYREGREMAARDEIKKAISWLKLAKGMASDKASEEHLETAIVDLGDLAMFLEKGEVVRAALMDKTFARAANALAKHHKFKGKEAVAKEDLKKAAHHLNAAAFNIRQAAKNANYEYGQDVVAVIEDYGPGYVEETAVLEENKLTQALDAIGAEIEVLEKKVKKSSE